MTQSNEQTLSEIFNMDSVHAVITGGASGIGLQIATTLASVGAAVTILDQNQERVTEAVSDLDDHFDKVGGRTVDITDFDAYEDTMASIAEERPFNVVFANAGISAGPGPKFDIGKLSSMDRDRWQDVLSVNLTGVVDTLVLASRHIPDQSQGRIVVTSSLAGVRADPLVGYAYAASKTGVLGLVRNAALELAGRGITVNAVAPGLFETNIRKENPAAESLTDAFARMSAIGRPGKLSELSGLAVFLASPASAYVTGAVLNIDGGGQHVGPNDG